MILCNFKTDGANVALEKKVLAQKNAFFAQTDLSPIMEHLSKKENSYQRYQDYNLVGKCDTQLQLKFIQIQIIFVA